MEFHRDLGLVMDQLGSPITTHDLGNRMQIWFAEEVEKKRQILVKSFLSTRGASVISVPQPLPVSPVVAEGTPSVSEPSGVRIRELAEIDSTTPSCPGTWDPLSPITGPVAGQPLFGETEVVIPDENGSISFADESVSLSNVEYEPSRIRGVVIGLLVGILLIVATIASGGLLLYSELLGDSTSPSSSINEASNSAKTPTDLITRTEETAAVVGGPSKIDEPVLPEPISAKSGPSAGDGGGIQAAQGEERVTVSLTVNAHKARVTVDGERHEDPSNIMLPRSSTPVEIVVTAPRYHSSKIIITPDADQEQDITLRRRSREPAKQTKRPPRDDDLIDSPYR